MVTIWGKKCYLGLTEISSIMYLGFFKDWGWGQADFYVLSLSTHNEGVAVVKSECSGRASFPVGKSWDSLFNSDCELSREKQWGGGQRQKASFSYFVAWSA